MRVSLLSTAVCGLLAALSVAQPALATPPNGEMWAWPPFQEVQPGAYATSTIHWMASSLNQAFITVDCGNGIALFAQTGTGLHQQDFTMIPPNGRCTFVMHADSYWGPEIGQVIAGSYEVVVPSGNVDASPETVEIMPTQASGTSTLSWSAMNVSHAIITRDCDGTGQGTALQTGGGPAGSVTVNVLPGSLCKYRLHVNSHLGDVMDEVIVRGVSVPAEPCQLWCTNPQLDNWSCSAMNYVEPQFIRTWTSDAQSFIVTYVSPNTLNASFGPRNPLGRIGTFAPRLTISDQQGRQVTTCAFNPTVRPGA